MAASGQIVISGAVTGLLTGSKQIGPVVISDSAASPSTTEVVLASGFNTISIPTTTTVSAALVIFAAASTGTKTLKGVTGDTGIALLPNGVNVINLATSATSFGITTSAADTANITEILFI